MSRRLLPQPGQGYHLSKFGYSLSHEKSSRHSSLKAASKKYGTLPVLKRINLIRNITSSEYETKKKLTADVNFMKKLYKKESTQMARSNSRKGTKRNTQNKKKGTKKGTKKSTRKSARK
jgi:hypothetical protein